MIDELIEKARNVVTQFFDQTDVHAAGNHPFTFTEIPKFYLQLGLLLFLGFTQEVEN